MQTTRFHRSARPAILAPGRPALAHHELAAFLESAAGALRDFGISSEHRIAAVLPNGPEAATAFLAITSCAAYAPLNPGYQLRDFEFYLADLKADALLIQAGDASTAARAAEALEIPVLRMETDHGWPAGFFRLEFNGRPGAPRASNGNAALLLHTSGTTSRPKLVPLTAANLAASAQNISATLALGEADRCLNIMPLFHIHGLMAALLAAITSGGSVVCTGGVYATSFFDWLEEFAPTWYTAVPTMHQAILARAAARKETARAAGLRFLRSCSAALAPHLLSRLEEAFQAPLIEAYGMTEAAHQMASNPLPPRVRKPGSVGPAGGPELAVMDESGNLLAPGEVGEVVIRGANVTPGYESNPEANRAAFTNGWFRTGDQGRLDEDGYLRLTGRLKELINRGGEKISPREIDETMLEHQAVRQAVTFAIPHAQLGEEVGVAVELHPGRKATEAELRRFAAARLPAFKAPKLVRLVDEIPKGPTGKLQRIGLAARLGIEPLDHAAARAEYVEPRDELERRLAAIWRDVLGAERVGAQDRFESLGGDSLLAVRVIVEANRSFGCELPFLRFLEEGTLAAMASELREASNGSAAKPGMIPVRPDGGTRPVYCAPGHDGVLLGIRRLSGLLEEAPMWAYRLPAGRSEARVPALGREMADLIERLQPEGPVSLLGVCFGGLVAYEAACELQSRGRAVEPLVMIDTLNPAWKRSAGSLAAAAAFLSMCRLRLKAHWRAVSSLDWKERRAYLAGRFAAFRESVEQKDNVYRGAQASYTPRRRFAGRAILFEMTGRRLSAPTLGWGSLLAGLAQLKRLPFDPCGSLSERTAPLVARELAQEFKFHGGRM